MNKFKTLLALFCVALLYFAFTQFSQKTDHSDLATQCRIRHEGPIMAQPSAQERQKFPEPNFKGGTLRFRIAAWPKNLNAVAHSDAYIALVWSLTSVSLLDTHQDTLEDIPFLATSWQVSEDKKTYTFDLDPDATWADGKPITSQDVVFTYELMYDPKRCVFCEPTRSFTGPIETIKALGPHQVELKVKRLHFDNLARFSSLAILPKHLYNRCNFDKDFGKVIWGGGPYVYDYKESKLQKTFVLKRRKHYWANKHKYQRERANFDEIVIRNIDDETVAFEKFKRKELDFYYFDMGSYRFWDNKNMHPFTDPNVMRLEAEKYNPSSWSGIALNQRQGILKDKNVRKALQYLLNRELIISKVFNNHLRPITGPFMQGSKYAYPAKPVSFDPKKARELLKKAGFIKTEDDGILYRNVQENGKIVKQRMSVKIIFSTDDHGQWLTIFKEDAQKAGVEIIPRLVEWSAALKLLDEFNYEGFAIGWTGSPVPAPEQLFHGRSADKKGSSNLPGLNNSRINKLIDLAPTEFDEAKRIKMYHEIEKLIIDEQPYVFRWTDAKHSVAFWKDRLNPTQKPYMKFGGTHRRSPFYIHWRAKQ
ncbi:MAG: ABC transporter substrate-binding protein [Myxococcota bacterium]